MFLLHSREKLFDKNFNLNRDSEKSLSRQQNRFTEKSLTVHALFTNPPSVQNIFFRTGFLQQMRF